jgi:hypothetical protein
MLESNEDKFGIEETLESWVMEKCREWRDHYESNYETKFDEYYRLWRGIFSSEDRNRDSERSQIISPALQQAVESSVAEIEEATFGRGKFFDIKDDDQQPQDVAYLREQLTKDFKKNKVRKAVGECLINAAVYGTGIAELVLEERKEMRPASRPTMDGQLQEVGVEMFDRTVCKLRSVQPQNFLIDPPRHLLENDDLYEEVEELVPSDEDKTFYVEAIVVIANGGTLLKAEKNPYMMQDRPVIAFPWDVVPNRFWGRGVCEKGYNSQKALDAELRARIDALALTVHPMMAMDATRLPRGARPEIKAGKIILTNGNPAEILQPFNFGQVNQITFAQAAELQKMVQTATGAIDSAGIPGSINGEATAAGISMSLGAIIKRHKRTLINFQESFLIPFVSKAAYRYMQFEPEIYPVADYQFEVSSSLGIIAREYEVTQLVQLLQTMGQDSPLYPTLIQSIIDNMNLSNREELI